MCSNTNTRQGVRYINLKKKILFALSNTNPQILLDGNSFGSKELGSTCLLTVFNEMKRSWKQTLRY